jgi:hypothetical protein
MPDASTVTAAAAKWMAEVIASPLFYLVAGMQKHIKSLGKILARIFHTSCFVHVARIFRPFHHSTDIEFLRLFAKFTSSWDVIAHAVCIETMIKSCSQAVKAWIHMCFTRAKILMLGHF